MKVNRNRYGSGGIVHRVKHDGTVEATAFKSTGDAILNMLETENDWLLMFDGYRKVLVYKKGVPQPRTLTNEWTYWNLGKGSFSFTCCRRGEALRFE